MLPRVQLKKTIVSDTTSAPNKRQVIIQKMVALFTDAYMRASKSDMFGFLTECDFRYNWNGYNVSYLVKYWPLKNQAG